MQDPSDTQDLAIRWFRQASPYIKAHRGSTVVLCLPDTILDSDMFDQLIQDVTLLSHLGVRLVITFGLRSRVDATLLEKQTSTTVIDGRRVTDDAALDEILTWSGRTRTLFEAKLSMGLPNTPMSGSRLSVTSGNYITAQPFGVHNGIDYQHTGTVRQVHSEALHQQLSKGNLVLLPPVGYSFTGDVFNLPTEEIAVETAIALKADKLVFFASELPLDDTGATIREASATSMERLAQKQSDDALIRTLNFSVHATRKGVSRVHLLSLTDPNALLRELFTRDGSGTLVTAERWENLRNATITDVNGIIDLILPLQENGTLAIRNREQLELDIEQFVVCEREGMVIACAALFVGPVDQKTGKKHGEIACVVTHPEYRGQGRAGDLIAHLENKARAENVSTLMLLSTRAAHWFIERGYTEQSAADMPVPDKIYIDKSRNSKLFGKQL